MTHKGICCPPADPIVTRPTQIVRDFYHPQLVQVIHPIEVINRHHCVPVYNHVYTYVERNVGPLAGPAAAPAALSPYAHYGAAVASAKRRKK